MAEASSSSAKQKYKIANQFALAPKTGKKGAPPQVEVCKGTYNTIIQENASVHDKKTQEKVLDMFRKALEKLYERDPEHKKYIFKLNREKSLTEEQYNILMKKDKIEVKDLEEQCQKTDLSSTTKKKKKTGKEADEKTEKHPTDININKINATVRKAMKQGFKEDKNEAGDSLPTAKIYGRKSYAPSPWLQILKNDKYVLAEGAGAKCTGKGDCTLEGHICVDGFCEMAESKLVYNNPKKELVYVIRAKKEWTPTMAYFITKYNPESDPLEVKKTEFTLQPFRTCPPRVINKIEIDVGGKMLTLNQLAANRTQSQITQKIGGDYSVLCTAGSEGSHGRWINAYGNKVLLDHYNQINNNQFVAVAAKSEQEFKELLENFYNVRLFDTANKGIPYVIRLTEGDVLQRVYPFGTDIQTINQLYSQKSLNKALDKVESKAAENYMDSVRQHVTKQSQEKDVSMHENEEKEI